MDMNKNDLNPEVRDLIILTLAFGSAVAVLHFFFGGAF